MRALILTAAFIGTTFSQTSIGTKFAARQLYGVLDGAGADAKITNMLAGVSCVFR